MGDIGYPHAGYPLGTDSQDSPLVGDHDMDRREAPLARPGGHIGLIEALCSRYRHLNWYQSQRH